MGPAARPELLLQGTGLLLRVQAAVSVTAHLRLCGRLRRLRLQLVLEPTQVLILGDLLALVPLPQPEECVSGEVTTRLPCCEGGASHRRPGCRQPAGDHSSPCRCRQRYRGGGALRRASTSFVKTLSFRGGMASPRGRTISK